MYTIKIFRQDYFVNFCNILIGGEKGGTGKSTIATNLAVMLRIAGVDTHLIDCDRQKTSLKFASRRATQKIFPSLVCTHLSGEQLQIPIIDLAEKYEAVIIDCGGQDSVELRSSMITPCIDLMIVPIQAGYFDLETLVNMNNLVRVSKMYNKDLQVKCLINRVPSHKLITVAQEAKTFINDELEYLSLLETILHDRVSFSYSVAKGLSVVEYEKISKRDGKGANEMMLLYKEITGEDFPIMNISDLDKSLEIENA